MQQRQDEASSARGKLTSLIPIYICSFTGRGVRNASRNEKGYIYIPVNNKFFAPHNGDFQCVNKPPIAVGQSFAHRNGYSHVIYASPLIYIYRNVDYQAVNGSIIAMGITMSSLSRRSPLIYRPSQWGFPGRQFFDASQWGITSPSFIHQYATHCTYGDPQIVHKSPTHRSPWGIPCRQI